MIASHPFVPCMACPSPVSGPASFDLPQMAREEGAETPRSPVQRIRDWIHESRAPRPLDEDAADMVAMAAGDEKAIERIIERWTPRLHGFLTRFLGSESDVPDLIQETFLRVHRHHRRYKPHKPFSTWIFQICSNLARNHLRSGRRRPAQPTCPTVISDLPLEGSGSTPGDELEAAERVQQVRAAVLKLPPMARETLVLSVYEELPHSEIAKIMKTTEKAVELRLYRARQLLKAELGDVAD